jgi:rod shape-determining protein MreD
VFGSLLGEQALRLCILAFLVLRFRARLRFFPLSQQALAVLVLLTNDRIVVMAVRVASGEGVPPADFWLSPLVGMLLWPWLFLIFDQLRMRSRFREG